MKNSRSRGGFVAASASDDLTFALPFGCVTDDSCDSRSAAADTQVSPYCRRGELMTKPTLIILAHPDLSESQINASWYAKLIEQAPCLRFHDLYGTYPHWNIDV